MRVVLDTNVVVSGLIKPGGPEGIALLFALRGQYDLFVSPSILAEYRSVLGRPRFSRWLPASDVRSALMSIEQAARLVHPATTLTISRDDPDNRFLECAEASRAEYLVTGNLRHYPKAHRTTRIVNAREFLSLLVNPET